MLRQQLAHALAHVTDAQGEQHAAEGLFLGVHELAHHLLGGLLPHGDGVARTHALLGVVGGVPAPRLQARDVVYGEGIEVGHVVNQAGLEHLVHQLVADAVDVHAAAAHPVQQALLELCRAVERDTAVGHLALFVHHGAAAHGTARGHLPGQRVCGALVGHRPHDLGDHVARLVHHDRVAHAHVLAVHLVDIVQRGARDGGAGHRHRVELGHRGEHARAAHLHADLAQNGRLLLGRELERDGPARGTGGKAQLVLLRKGIDLYHHAVDVVIELAAVRQGIGAEGMDLGRGAAGGHVGVDGEPGIAQPAQELVLAVHVERVGIGHRVDKRGEVARGRDFGVFLTKRPCGGVAGVGKRVAPGGVGLLVQTREAALGHIDLAAHLDRVGTVGPHVHERRLGQMHGHVVDGAHVERDVLARGAVATRGRAHKGAVLVGERHAQAVNLELAGVDGTAGTKGRLGALEPCVELVQVHGIVHGVHARHVRDGRELLGHVAAHALRIGRLRHQLGIGGLDLLELHEHLVKGGIGDLGRIEHVVTVGVVIELVPKLRRTGRRRLARAHGGLRRIPKQALLLGHQSVLSLIPNCCPSG